MTAAKSPPKWVRLTLAQMTRALEMCRERLAAVEKRELALREALATCRSALRAVASCRVCGDGTQVGFQQHHGGCWPDDDLPEVDLDEVVQSAWETANAALAAADEGEKSR